MAVFSPAGDGVPDIAFEWLLALQAHERQRNRHTQDEGYKSNVVRRRLNDLRARVLADRSIGARKADLETIRGWDKEYLSAKACSSAVRGVRVLDRVRNLCLSGVSLTVTYHEPFPSFISCELKKT